MKVICAFDSFKGCMTSLEAGEAAKKGVMGAMPGCMVSVMPMADGGEGTIDAIRSMTGGREVPIRVLDPLLRERESEYVMDCDGETAYIEMAQCAGLTMLTPDERDAMRTSSYGLGMAMAKAIEAGAKHITICLGGSATNDAALGALQALGLKVYTRDGILNRPVTGTDLIDITDIDATELDSLKIQCDITVLYDADIPFCGPMGAVRLYAPQKGVKAEDLDGLERGMKNVREVVERKTGIKTASVKGAGAAGGAGYGLAAIAGAKMESGIEYMLSLSDFDAILDEIAIVLTGEGKADSQTLQGKVSAGILSHARNQGVPVWLFSGKVENKDALLKAGFGKVVDINAGQDTAQDPMDNTVARRRLENAVRCTAEDKIKKLRRLCDRS
jgi:glycerate kinase